MKYFFIHYSIRTYRFLGRAMLFRNYLKCTKVHPIYRGTLFLCRDSGVPQAYRPRWARHQEQKFHFGLLNFGRLHNEGRRTFTLRSSKAKDGSRTRRKGIADARVENTLSRRTPNRPKAVLIRVNPCQKNSVNSVPSVAKKQRKSV